MPEGERGGSCHWAGCENEADYNVYGLKLERATIRGKEHRFRPPLLIGDIQLCGGHARMADEEERIKLDEEVIEWAVQRAVRT